MKKKRLLFVLLISAMICLSIIACAKPPQELSEGPETGEYFYDAETDEYRITLNSGNKFTLLLETTKSGEYTLEDGVLTLVPNKLKDIEQEPAITATYSDRVIIYKNMRFVERIIYTVSFNSNGGTDVDPIPVLNGRTISKPRLDPTRGTSVFYGWYTDNTLSTPFMFGTPVTADIELFAKWVEPIPGQNEFLIGFDLNYPDAPAVTSAKTIGGKLHSAPEPIRDGYVFKGWWVSMYENKNMLSYPLVTTAEADLPSVSYLSTVFEESTTLYALWLTAATANSTPIVRINETGIEWSGILGVGTYRVDITGPNGFSEGASVGLATYNFAFSDRAAGDYIITVGAGSIITTIYYRNKALARVSLFNVVEPSLLIYNPVKNATKYLVYIKCGDILHNHDPFNNGTSTYYNFANCSMREGGIEFTVRAEANGFAPSVSKKFIHSRDLSQIVRWSFDSANQILSWDAVPNATNYIVGIDDGKPHQFDNGGKTSVSLKEYARGDMMVKVTPATKGWNSPLPSQYPYTKTNLSTPLITGISGQFVEWTPVTGATVYDIKIGNDNPVELTEDYELPANLNDVISIRARGTGVTDSLWSDPIAVGVSMTGLSYYQNIVSWNYVTGATAYEVWLNDEYLCEAEGVNFAVISLAKPGANKIEVRADVNSSLASIEVFAHTLSFDSRGGDRVEPQYCAFGDAVTLPEPGTDADFDYDGYEFRGWYNTPGGSVANGAKYSDKTFTDVGDLLLYAYWAPKPYIVTYDTQGGNLDKTEEVVTFGGRYDFAVPTIDNGTAFLGWYTAENGGGTRLTDEYGNSLLSRWDIPSDTTIYAHWGNVLKFVLQNNNTYRAESGADISLVTEVNIPSTYTGTDGIERYVTDVAAFDSNYLKSIRIPATVTRIGDSAFTLCPRLEEIIVDQANTTYRSIGGVLYTIYSDIIDQEVLWITYCPIGITGTHEIPNGVEEIFASTFRERNSLAGIIIPSSVKRIGDDAFRMSSGLTTVIFTPRTYEEGEDFIVGTNAFRNCSSLSAITLPANFKFPDDNASNRSAFFAALFSGCTSLQSIDFEGEHTALTSIEGALYTKTYTEVTEIIDEEEVTVQVVSRYTLFYFPLGLSGEFTLRTEIDEIPVTLTLSLITANVGAVDLIIPGNIPASLISFQNWLGLNSVTFAGGHTSAIAIAANSFNGCGNLKTVTFEDGTNISTLGPVSSGNVFNNCSSLHTVIFAAGSKIATIGGNAFSNCGSLKDVIFEVGCDVTAISASAFTNTVIEEIEFPNTLKNVGAVLAIANSAFSGNNSLMKITFRAGGEAYTIGSAFVGHNALAEVEFEDGIEIIALNGTFQNCPNLTTITIPASVQTIGANTFSGTSAANHGLEEIIFEDGSQLTSLGTAFSYSKIQNITLPVGITSIAASVFANCLYLETVTFLGNLTGIGNNGFDNCGELHTVTFASHATGTFTIGSQVFRNCGKLKNITLPGNLTSIGANAFENCFALESVTIPAGITSATGLGANAFLNCTGLTTLTFAAGLTTLPANAFTGCTGLISVTLPNTLLTFTSTAFTGCINLAEYIVTAGGGSFSAQGGVLFNADRTELVRYPVGKPGASYDILSSVTAIRADAFVGARFLTSLTLPASVKTIGAAAFQGLTGITSMALPNGLTSIGADAFRGMTGLTEINIPSTVAGTTAIGNNAFDGCVNLTTVIFDAGGANLTFGNNVFARTGLTSIKIPSRLTNTGTNTFDGCASLVSVTFDAGGDNLTIGNSAFLNAGITSIILPGRLIAIGTNAFDYCAALRTVSFDAGTANLSFGNYAFARSGITTIAIPGRVNSIGTNVFDSCAALRTASFDAGTATFALGNQAFARSGITAINIPGRITGTGTNTFDGCASLRTVTFDSDGGNLAIGNSAFLNSGVTSVIIPSRVNSMGTNVFDGCASLRTVEFAAGGNNMALGNFAFARSGVTSVTFTSRITNTGTNAFLNCTFLSTVILPASGLTVIGANAFQGCTALSSITIPSSISGTGGIGANAFDGCTSLATVEFAPGGSAFTFGNQAFARSGVESIIIPNRVTAMTGNNVFLNCTRLASVTFSTAMVIIPANTFQGCTALTAVTIPSSIAGTGGIGANAFDGCTNLTTVEFAAGGSAFTFGNQAFARSGITSIIIPNRVTAMTGTNVFLNCTSLASVTFSTAMTAIPANTFTGCTALTAVTIPSSISGTTGIGANAFDGCTNLESVEFAPGGSTLGFGNAAFARTGLIYFEFPDRVSTTGNSTFQGCTALRSITIPARITALGSSLFSGCTALETVTVEGDNQTSSWFGGSVFENCTSLTSVFIPRLVTAPNYANFTGSGILNFVVHPDNAQLSTVDGILVNDLYGCGNNIVLFPAGRTGHYVIPDTITTIGERAFQDNKNLTGLTIPASVKTVLVQNPSYPAGILMEIFAVGNAAFQNATALKSIIILPGTELFNTAVYAFSGCGIESITIPARAQNATFGGWDGVRYLYAVNSYAFASCQSLKSVTFEEKDPGVTYSITGGVIQPSTVMNYAFGGANASQACGALETVVFAGHIVRIGPNVFQNCISLESVTLVEGLESIGTYAFSGSTLRSIHIPSTIKLVVSTVGATAMETISQWGIDTYAFYLCRNLETVTFARGGSNFGLATGAFHTCTAIKRISIPSRCIYAQGSTFSTWSADQTIFFEGHRGVPFGWTWYGWNSAGTCLATLEFEFA